MVEKAGLQRCQARLLPPGGDVWPRVRVSTAPSHWSCARQVIKVYKMSTVHEIR